MGGIWSGRPAIRQTVDECVVLDITKLLAQIGEKGREGCWNGAIQSTNAWPISGLFELSMKAEIGQMRLRWSSLNALGSPLLYENVIALTSMPQHFGGRQWYFVCPLTGKRAKKLYLTFGGDAFGCRAAYSLVHQAQREQRHCRALRRAFKLRARLGDKGDIGDIVLKPKRLQWNTFGRLLSRLSEAEAIVDAHTALLDRKIATL